MDRGEKVKNDPINAKIGKIIRDQRQKLGMTQESLAEKLRVTSQQIQKYEVGANCVKIGRLAEVSDVLGIPLNSFFAATYSVQRLLKKQMLQESEYPFIHGEKKEKPSDKEQEDPISLEEIDEFLLLFLRLNRESQNSIVVLVKELSR